MTDMSQEKLLTALAGDDPPVVIDVRSFLEYNTGHIAGARRIPFFSVLLHRKRLPADKTKSLVLTCEHGPRASVAGVFLKLLGYRNIYHLEGHMAAWKENHRPTVS